MKRWLLNKLTKGLLPTFDVKDIISFDSFGHLFIEGQRATNQQILNLQAEVNIFQESELWKYMNANLNKHVSKLVFEKSETMTDLIVGKTILYTLDIQFKMMEKILQAKLER